MNITLTIRGASVKTEADTEALILWKRGAKSIDTRVKILKAETNSVTFNEKF